MLGDLGAVIYAIVYFAPLAPQVWGELIEGWLVSIEKKSDRLCILSLIIG